MQNFPIPSKLALSRRSPQASELDLACPLVMTSSSRNMAGDGNGSANNYLSALLRAAMGLHVVDILRQDLSVVLDFPANTVRWRSWMRSMVTEADVAHELHVLDVPDAICKERLQQRNESGDHQYQVGEPTYDQFMSYFVFPTPDEGFNIVAHTP